MEIPAKIKFEDYWRFYKKNYLFRYAPIVLLFLVPLIFYAEYLFHDEYDHDDWWIYILILILMIFFTIYRIYSRTKKAFFSNQRIQENHTYYFDESGVKIKGETFNSAFDWKTLHHVKELKNWFLLYQSSQVMNLVPKNNLTQNQKENLRQIIRNSGVKNQLRSD